jgi:Phosphatidylinositol-specific phospholipase C, X domain
MAEHMKAFLGNMLYAEPVGEESALLPSPEDLKRKILVKAKKLPPGKTFLQSFY